MASDPLESLRIAFTSCMSTEAFAVRQPVWEYIDQQKPDVLVLLGDSIYIDSPWPLGPTQLPTHPRDLTAYDFAEHVHSLYARQLAVPEFRKLLRRPGLRVHAVWNDHDFLWHNALKPQLKQHQQHAIFSSNLFRCWCDTLRHGSAFPASLQDPRIHPNTTALAGDVHYERSMPGYRHDVLHGGRVVLHLPDGRSGRTSQTLLGTRQRAAIEVQLRRYPDAQHVLASGSTLQATPSPDWHHYAPGSAWLEAMIYGPKHHDWKAYPADFGWLKTMADRHDLLVLSGGIHKNARPTPLPCGNRQLREYTASGAAVDCAHFLGDKHPHLYAGNFGILTLAPGKRPQVQYFHHSARLGDLSDHPV